MQNLMRGMAQLFAVAAERYDLDDPQGFVEGLVELTKDEEEMDKLAREVAGGVNGIRNSELQTSRR